MLPGGPDCRLRCAFLLVKIVGSVVLSGGPQHLRSDNFSSQAWLKVTRLGVQVISQSQQEILEILTTDKCCCPAPH